MSYQIPLDLIQDLQIKLRTHAGLPTYDPNDPSIPPLPSLSESVSGSDPSTPSYLRCKNCNATLLRGLQSFVCVYCGKDRSSDIVPEPIRFKSTAGFQWLLQSLSLNGSETVGPSIEATTKSNRGQSAPKDEVSLSDLLDLEIKWPAESEKFGSGINNESPVQSKYSLNLAGVDLDNFFSEAKKNSLLPASEEQSGQTTDVKVAESNAFQGHQSLSLFENVGPSKTAVRATEDESGDRFSGWEAEFQSASSGIVHDESNSLDPFKDSTVDLSAHMDTVFGSIKDSKDGKPKDVSTPASIADDWIQDDIWNNFNSGASKEADKLEVTFEFKDGPTVDGTKNPSTTNVDLIQDDQWQTTNSKAPVNKMTYEDDESFDAWNGFTSSTSAQETSNISWKQTANHITPSAEQTSETNLFSSTNDSQDMDFGSFPQPDVLSSAFGNQNGSTKANDLQSKVSVLDRMVDEHTKNSGNSEQVGKGEDVSSATMRSQADDVEMLMSQMHDLSFMLDSNLSIPKS